MLSSNSLRSFAKLYTRTHEWVELAGLIGTVGITQHRADRLGEILFAGVLPGGDTNRGDALGDVESVSAMVRVRAPVAGTVVAVNPRLRDSPELINSAAETDGWIAKIRVRAPALAPDLLDAESYTALVRRQVN
jgi:glycine cleavage system H protein